MNKNGIFINLNACCEKTILDITNFLDFIEENKKHLNDLEDKINQKKCNLINNNNMFSQSTLMDNNQLDNSNEKTRFISSDYSPFITDDNIIIDNDDFEFSDNVDETALVNNDNIVDFNDELDENINDDDEICCSDEEDLASNSVIITVKKKKNMGIKARILKRCKNINGLSNDNLDEIDKDFEEEAKNTELMIEAEYI
jgi:hypothetical protein